MYIVAGIMEKSHRLERVNPFEIVNHLLFRHDPLTTTALALPKKCYISVTYLCRRVL